LADREIVFPVWTIRAKKGRVLGEKEIMRRTTRNFGTEVAWTRGSLKGGHVGFSRPYGKFRFSRRKTYSKSGGGK